MSVWPRINRTAGVHITNEENELELRNIAVKPKRMVYAHQWAQALTDDELLILNWGPQDESKYIKQLQTIAKVYGDFFSCSVTKILPEVVKFIVTASITELNFSVSLANETIQESIKRLFKTSAYRPIIPVGTILGFYVARNIASTQRTQETVLDSFIDDVNEALPKMSCHSSCSCACHRQEN